MDKHSQLDVITDELYAHVPSEFTSARNARVREARAAGDADLADALGRLHKPTVAAWLANALVRARPREVADLLALGVALAKAQAAFDGDALRRLSEQRHQVVRGLSRDAQRLADKHGQSVSDAAVRELEGTLEAGLFDPDAAEQLRHGRLTGALTYSGIGFPSSSPSGASSASSTSLKSQPRGAPRSRDTTNETRQKRERTGSARFEAARIASAMRQAQSDLRDARRVAKQATTAFEKSERASEQEKAALSAAQAEVTRRRESVRAAEHAVVRSRADRDAAAREVRRAEERLEKVQRPTT